MNLPRITSRGFRLSVLPAVWFSALPLCVAAQSDPVLEDFETRYVEAVKQIEAQLLQAGQQIEDEQQALLDKLGKTHDELQAERRRADALEARLRALNGEASAVTDIDPGVTPTDQQAAHWLAFPERSVNALGLMEAQDIRIGTVPLGTDTVAIVWPTDVALPDGAVRPSTATEGNRTHVQVATTLGPPRTLATLRVEGEALFWTWHALSPGDASDALAYLDTALPRCGFDAQRADVTLASLQFRPLDLLVGQRADTQSGVVLRPGIGRFRLGAEVATAGWVLLADRPDEVGWVSPALSWQVALAPDGESVTVRRGPGLERRTQDLERQRRQWEQDLARRDADAVGVDTARVQAELERIDEAQQKLESARQTLSTQAGPLGSPVVRLLTPDGRIVLARLTLATEGR